MFSNNTVKEYILHNENSNFKVHFADFFSNNLVLI